MITKEKTSNYIAIVLSIFLLILIIIFISNDVQFQSRDTKTVQPNIGAYSKFVEQILNWYAFFYSHFPDQIAESRIVFPYNPHDEVFWDKTMGKGKPLERDNEGWVENQFWNFCSGLQDTYRLIVESFTELRESKELEVDLDNMLN